MVRTDAAWRGPAALPRALRLFRLVDEMVSVCLMLRQQWSQRLESKGGGPVALDVVADGSRVSRPGPRAMMKSPRKPAQCPGRLP